MVKPAFGTGAGQGVTTHICSENELAWACARALKHDRRLLIERQIAGENYRLLFCRGDLLDVVRRDPPHLIGDGRSTVRKLIQNENRRRVESWENAQSLLQIDQDAVQTLRHQGYRLKSVPGDGERFQVKTVINDNAAHENVSVTDEMGISVIDSCRQAASLLGVQLAGVDIITPDPTVSLVESKGVILEVNTTPGLYIHKRGKTCPVALSILKAMLDQHIRKPEGPVISRERKPS